ncbi:MAG: ATP-binding protein [Stappiaceae bacterium]
MVRSLVIGFGIYAALSVSVAVWVYFDAFETSLEDDRIAGNVRLSEASSRLRGQLDVYRALVNIVAKDPDMAKAFSSERTARVDENLSVLSLTYGAWEVDLADPTGHVVASSAPDRLGHVYAPQLIQSALNGRLGYAIDIENGERLIRYSRGVPDPEGDPVGAVVVSANLAALEFQWPVTPEPVVFFNDDHLSMSANRPDLLLLSNADDPRDSRFPVTLPHRTAGTTLSTYVPSQGQVREVQTLSTEIPQLEMIGKILLDTRNARAFALLRMGLAATLMVALGLIAAIFVQQRRRLALESRHSATLEERVEARTAELRAAQDELVEASNLAALGRLSAGVSHELNQPLAAILNFAENGRRLIERARTSEAAENLSQIADQVRRITRIIGNLRAFARQENAPSDRVDLVEVTNRAMKLVQNEIASAGVEVEVTLPDEPVFVMAGRVRLEQVVLNLVSNALDAMQTTDEKKLSIELKPQADSVTLSVRDTGTGIEETERVFEPFYTTKELGSSKGLGMGLALSFGLITRFGGQLNCRNREQGAEFIITLPISEASS